MMKNHSSELIAVVADEVMAAGLRDAISDFATQSFPPEILDSTIIQELLDRNPELIILFLDIDPLTVLQAVGNIKYINPQTKVLIVTYLRDNLDHLESALRGQVDGYYPLGSSSTKSPLSSTVRLILEGAKYFDQNQLTNLYSQNDRPIVKVTLRKKRLVESLTEREFEVIEYIRQGLTNIEIAEILEISPSTVKNHISNVFKTLEVHTRAEAISLLLETEYVVIPNEEISVIEKLYRRLSEREREVIEYLADGLKNAKIAEILCISEHTVKHHVENILSKLELSNRTELPLFMSRYREFEK